MMKRLEVLISCMGQDILIAERTGVKSDALIIDQCDENSREEIRKEYLTRMIRTTERGLSKSRNAAIREAVGDIILFCDDDEHLDENYVKTILAAYEEIPDADVIAFRMKNQPSRLKQKKQKLNTLTALRISSWQITCRTESIRRKGIYFDTLMGAGSGNGAQEEVKFLRECMKRGLRAWYVPADIGEVGNAYYETGEEEGTWFTGFDEKFFYQRGTSTRYMLGLPLSILYAFYYTAGKRKMYAKHISPAKALKCTLSGILHNDLNKQKKERGNV